MDFHISPRLYEKKYKEKKNTSKGNYQAGSILPGRPRMDTRKCPNSQLKSVDIVVKSQISKSSEPSNASSGSRARIPRNKPILPTCSCDTTDFGQENHLEVIQPKAGEILASPSPQLKSIRCADASSQNGDRICSESLFVSQANPIRACEVNSCKDSANMGDKIKASSTDLVIINKFIEDQLEPLALANSLDKSVIIDNSDTSTTTTDLPGEDSDNFFKVNPQLESKIVWREGLLQRWKGLKNREIDALLLLSNCADLEQKFPQPTRFGGPSAKSEVCPSSPGSDTSTSSNLSLLSSVWSGQSYCKPLNTWNKPFTPANQNPKARSDQSHEVAAIPATITVHPIQQISLQAKRPLDNYGLGRPEEEEREIHHNMICYKSSIEHRLSPLKIPPLSADYKKETISDNQKDPASLTRRPAVWTHGALEDGKHTIHYETRKSTIPFLDEVLEFQGIRDVHVVEIPAQNESARALPSFSAGSGLTSDLIGIPKPNPTLSDMKLEHTYQKKCTNISSNPNIRCISSSPTSNHCKTVSPEEKGHQHRPATEGCVKQLASKLDRIAGDEDLCRCYHHSQEMQNKAENCNSSYTFAIAATASAGLLVVGTCLIGYICHRRFGRFRKFRLNVI